MQGSFIYWHFSSQADLQEVYTLFAGHDGIAGKADVFVLVFSLTFFVDGEAGVVDPSDFEVITVVVFSEFEFVDGEVVGLESGDLEVVVVLVVANSGENCVVVSGLFGTVVS